ncbi:protein DpdH [Paraburkholderia sediminicola]|uniref:protein DpdH n=1 Tax=Paraburkholderia sediminicola TaxID=458836 RepID=UPI0038B9F088
MSLLKYWPTADEVDRCIKPEAESAHESVLLAVHQPSPLSYRLLPEGSKVPATEEDLFDYLINTDVPTGAHVVPITGASGVGKSHLVRILAARLNSSSSASRYVVIRIPKSASLREVVQLILKPLPDGPYASVKADFKKALSEVNLETAVINFQAHLEIALGDFSKHLQGQLQGNPQSQMIKEQLAHARALPKFLTDAAVVDHMRTMVFRKIVQRAMAGNEIGKTDVQTEDFTADDFNLPDSIDLEKASLAAKQYYRLQLLTRNRQGMKVAASVLNGRVVDQAIRELFQLHEAIGGMTLQDVILEIRRLLLADSRELIILVEDFKALTGIQETLLNVLIQEGVRDGVRQLATMRSVIAVTEGYLAGKDTIATRAKREWIVESHLSSPEEVIRRTKNLVATYLNAARLGETVLIASYESRDRDSKDRRSWLPIYSDQDDGSAANLAAFGSVQEIPLFPFTESAIACLAKTTLTEGDTLVFTPRFIIDRILRDTLLSGREAFKDKRFPPTSILAPASTADIAQWAAALPMSSDERGRYERLVNIWGDNPKTRNDVGQIEPVIFDTFNLPRPDIVRTAAIKPPEPSIPVEPKTPVSRPADPPTTEELRLAQILENWVQKNERLPQDVSASIRKHCAAAVNERIDWVAERCVKVPITGAQVSIPNAQGEGGVASLNISISNDNSDPDGKLRGELLALLRLYALNDGRLDYPLVDDDLARIGNLVTRLFPQVLKVIRAEISRRLRTSTRILMTNSRLLGITEKARTVNGLPKFLFSEAQLKAKPTESAPVAFQEWRTQQDEALSIRNQLVNLVLANCGCYQGEGRTPYGIDVIRLVEHVAKDDDAPENDLIPQDIRARLSAMSETRLSVRAKRVIDEASRIATSLKSELGENFVKQELSDAMKDLAERMKKIGVWNQEDMGTTNVFNRICEEFRATAFKEALATLDATPSEGPQLDGKLISRSAQLDINPILIAQNFVLTSQKVLANARKEASFLETKTKGLDSAVEVTKIAGAFDVLVADIDTLESEGRV